MTVPIPADWCVKPLGELARVYSGGTPLRSVGSYWNGPIPWVTTAEIDFGTINATRQSITELGLKASAAKIAPAGTVLIAMYGQGKTRGKSAILGVPAAMNQACAAVEVPPGLSAAFLLQYLSAQYDSIRALSNSGGQENLSGEIVKKIPIILPSEPEQQRISMILHDVDALISSLSRLLVKRQSTRQGLMQQLFSARARLPGFTEHLREMSLRDIGSSYGGLTGKSKEDFGHGTATFITFLEVMNHTRLSGRQLERVRVKKSEHQNRVLRGDVLFNGSSETPEEVALSAVVAFDPEPTTYLNSFCFGFRIKRTDIADPTFLAYLFRSNPGRTLIAPLAQGATRYNIAKTKLLDVALALPDLEEQRAIAAVMNDCEDEISATAMRLDKARATKQGMMQQLFTGRTRLPAGEVAS